VIKLDKYGSLLIVKSDAADGNPIHDISVDRVQCILYQYPAEIFGMKRNISFVIIQGDVITKITTH